MVRVVRAETRKEYQEAVSLFREYARSLGFSLDFQDFDREVNCFPGTYAPPLGCVLLSYVGDQAVGCVALRPLEEGVCELKRLYVVPEYRRTGVGLMLTREVIKQARRMRYRKMRLDTIETMVEANALYASVGFRRIEPYRFNPLGDAVFMEVDLAAR